MPGRRLLLSLSFFFSRAGACPWASLAPVKCVSADIYPQSWFASCATCLQKSNSGAPRLSSFKQLSPGGPNRESQQSGLEQELVQLRSQLLSESEAYLGYTAACLKAQALVEIGF